MKRRGTALVVGASRGLGLALAKELVARGRRVVGTVRGPATPLHKLVVDPATLRIVTLDIAIPALVHSFLGEIADERFDLVLLNGAVGQPADGDVMSLGDDDLLRVMLVNGVAPVRLAVRLLPQIVDRVGVVAFMSSRSGVVGLYNNDHEDLYRSSKATLNIFSRGFSANLPPERGLTVVTLTPGWVRTDMGGPDASLDPDVSARGLVDVLDAAAGRCDHRFQSYAGDVISW